MAAASSRGRTGYTLADTSTYKSTRWSLDSAPISRRSTNSRSRVGTAEARLSVADAHWHSPATRAAAEKWKLAESPPVAAGGEDRARARAGREDDLAAYETEERRVARAAVCVGGGPAVGRSRGAGGARRMARRRAAQRGSPRCSSVKERRAPDRYLRYS